MKDFVKLGVETIKDLLTIPPSETFSLVAMVSMVILILTVLFYIFRIGPCFSKYIIKAIDKDFKNGEENPELWNKVYRYEIEKLICYYLMIPTTLISLVYIIRVLLIRLLNH